MEDDFLDPLTPKEFKISEQKLEGDVKITPEFPVLKPKKTVITKRDPKHILSKRKEKLDLKKGSEGIGKVEFEDFKQINMNKTTAKKHPNQIFLGTDGNYYKSVKNDNRNYIWELID